MIFSILISLAIPAFLGISFVKYFETQQKLPLSLLLPIGFGLGFGFLTQWMLFLSIVQVRYTLVNISLPLLTMSIFLVLKKFLNGRNKTKTVPKRLLTPKKSRKNLTETLIDTGLSLYIGYIIFFVVARGITVPVLEWDAISWIALKGKIFFYERGIHQLQYLPNSAYPLHVPLSLTWIALNLRDWSETLVKIIFPTYFIAYGMLHYGVTKYFLNKLWAKGSLALLISASFFNYHATIAYRDIIMMYYFCAGILLVILWIKTNDNALLIFSALFLGFTSFVKLEGVIYTGIGLLVLSCAYVKKRHSQPRCTWISLSRFYAISMSIFFVYYFYKISVGATASSQNLSIAFSSVIWPRSVHLCKIFFNELFLSANWHIIWFLFFLSILQFKKLKNSLQRQIPLTVVIIFLVVYFVLGITTGVYDAFAEIRSSSVLPRILLHIYPLAVVFIALSHGQERRDGPPTL